MTYLEFLRRHGALASFGYGLAFTSSFGQTFFIAQSVPDIRASFGLSHAAFGSLYSAGTLLSGLLFIWAGSVLDRVQVRGYAMVALVGLTCASLALSVAPNVVVLGLALFGLRFFGQGMLGHAAVTSAARLPSGVRGRAMGLATLGFPTGEAVLPGIALAIIASVGWTWAWKAAAAIPFIALCLIAWLRPGAEERPPASPGGSASEQPPRRIDILRTRSFQIFLPAMVASPAIMTGLLFYQRHIGDAKGWSIELVAASLTAYAVASVSFGMLAGFAVDRFGGIRLSRFHLIGLLLSCLILMQGQGSWTAPAFFILMGCSAGANNVVVPAVLAELFGTTHLGRVRALCGSVMVVASALTPVIMGYVIDAGVGVGAIALSFAVYIALASAFTLALPARGN